MAKYDSFDENNQCIFCKIAQKIIPPSGNGIIYEDDNYMAFLSPFPNTEGFTVLITKEHYPSDVLNMPNDKLQEFILIAKKVSNMLINYFDDVGRVGLIMEGTGIDHAHIKLFPMHGTEHMKQGKWKQILSNKTDFFEKYQGYISSSEGPKADFEKLNLLAEKIRKAN